MSTATNCQQQTYCGDDYLDDGNAQDIVQVLSYLRAQMAVHSVRSQVRKAGLDKIPIRDIKILIKKTRAERKG